LPIGDLKAGIVDTGLQRAMLAFANAGFYMRVNVFKTGHNYLTSKASGSHPSAHSFGKAVDLGNFRAGDAMHTKAQQWWCDHAKQLGVKQVIGPDENLCYDTSVGISATYYNRGTLDEHKDHIHIGMPS
jgi:hypothetical protein